MKLSIDIDCSPQEARAFLGLPDVEEMQREMTEEVQKQLRAHIAAMDPEALMKTWMPMGTKAFETFRDAFMQGFQKRSSD
jgi:hypothetical protein